MLCHLVNTNNEGAYSLLLQSQAAYKRNDSEDTGTTVFWNYSNYLLAVMK